ncbi:hypothetical protein Nepgr_019697 [Nepenthes gracilis]|uniref:RING-type domain-containing protein n=1 Tax=Nepenthes gracilis TaxID=150966 RepID=A0AAD3SXK2_NEPGR|nr:hypothetical protein Nepgr_019697 [Nepenthes gracilis]
MAIQAQIYPENLGLPLWGSQDWTENGCGFNDFNFNHQQKQQQQQQQYLLQFQNQPQQRNQFLASENTLFFAPSMPNITATASAPATTNKNIKNASNVDNLLSPMSISQSMAAQFEKQTQEIDRCVFLQLERLKLAVQEQRKQQLSSLLRNLEAKATILVRQKDEEIAQARKRTVDLEDLVRKMELENQMWQRVAAESEATIASLSNTLDRMRDKACRLSSADDAESCCVEGAGENRGDEALETAQYEGGRNMICRICNSMNSCVLFLPCRHLCSCKACEAFLDACPVCKSVKKGSIEALIS